MTITKFFPTQIYTARQESSALNRQLLLEIEDLMDLDGAGNEWSRENYPNGFTSYSSANELQKTYPSFGTLEKWIDSRVARYARALDFDLKGGRLRMTNCWANVMGVNSHHSGHVHPLSVISGTYYAQMPKGSPAIKFEDPRLAALMHSPPRRTGARTENRTHVSVPAKTGTLVLFESWLRHEVPMHRTAESRVSVSFNYDWA
jgi:uncharacterized protein (TIGR02466 family)